VVVVSASIGAGHDGAATEIARRLCAGGITVDRHDFLDLLPPGWGTAMKHAYARQLAVAPASWGRLLTAAGRPRATAAAAALSGYAAEKRLLATIPPDAAAVVSTYPLASQVLGRLRLAGQLAAPAIAFMTDPSIHPLCVAAGIDLHLAPNHDATERIRRDFGLPAVTIFPVVDPRFRPTSCAADVLTGRRRHGLPPADRLALVVAGSWGVGDVEASVRDIAATGAATPVVVCGRNTDLRRRLAGSDRVVALGWVDDMPTLLRAVDVVVQNAGALSSLEALASGVALISYRCLPGHGVANAAVLKRLGLSAWPRTLAELSRALTAALDGSLRHRQQTAYRILERAPDATALIRDTARLPAAPARSHATRTGVTA
jgi:UDP-N-acetylglucosamine:LPS N-acetylglucosamine transferase